MVSRLLGILAACSACGRFAFDAADLPDARGDATASCAPEVGHGTRYEVTGAIPSGIPAEAMYANAFNLDVELDYFVRLTTP